VSYIIDSIEHVPDKILPPNPLFDDPQEQADLLRETVESIEAQ
jgi:hypothetical protein